MTGHTTKAILTRAVELTHKFGWTQDAMARRPGPKKRPSICVATDVQDPRAVCFCAMGFVSRAAFELGMGTPTDDEDAAFFAIRNVIGQPFISTWNDTKATDIGQVRSVLEQARDAV